MITHEDDRHLHDIAGRERFHGIRSADLEAELDGALLTASALARNARGIYLRAAVPADAKLQAEGMLNEAENPKRACGMSGVLCAHRHGPICPGTWATPRTLAEAWARVMPSGVPEDVRRRLAG